jgi:FtsH-binding integral membrane protein
MELKFCMHRVFLLLRSVHLLFSLTFCIYNFLGSAAIARSGTVHKWWLWINMAASTGCGSAYSRKGRILSIVIELNILFFVSKVEVWEQHI